MELNLTATDIIQVSPTSSCNTMKILPLGKKKKQKVAVGDDTGAVACFQMYKGEPKSVFKTIPLGTPITHLCLGGALGAKDKVFVASEQKIIGLSKKGKEFVKFHTTLTETIQNIFVEDAKIWAGAEYIYNLFDNGSDVCFYMCSDRINALTVEHVSRDSEYDAVLGCRDRFVRIIQGSECVMEASVGGSVIALDRYEDSRSGTNRASGLKSQSLLFGTENGLLGVILLDGSTIRRGWMVKNGSAQGSVNCLANFDLTADGVKDVVVGRDDGNLQVFSFESSSAEPTPSFERNVAESLRSVDCGIVGNYGFEELVYTSFSGKIRSYTKESMNEPDSDDDYGRDRDVVQNENQKQRIRREIAELEEKLEREKERFSKHASEFIPVTQQFTVNHKFVLDPDEAAYQITVEIPMPIDIVCLQSSVPVDLLDVDSNQAIVSVSPPNMENGNTLLATYRCQEEVNRLEMRVRTVEGQYGELKVIVVAKMVPKTAQLVTLDIKPLSLHHRLHSLEDERAVNSLRFTGSFSLNQMHEWVCLCLPEVPARVQGDEVRFTFRNVFLGNILLCTYRRGEATFQSDSVSAIAILKEVITKEATARKILVNLTFDINEDTVPGFLRLVHPKLDKQLALARKVELISSVEEIKMQETDLSWLSPEYQEVLENTEQIQKEFKERPRALEYLSGIVTDLFVDKHKFRGHNVKHKIPQLLQLLQNYDYDAVVAFFQEKH